MRDATQRVSYLWIEYPRDVEVRESAHDSTRRLTPQKPGKIKYELPDQVVVGREPGVALQIEHPRLRRRHFRLIRRKGRYAFRAYPKAEVRWNGVVTRSGKLKPGDVLEAGPFRFEYAVDVVTTPVMTTSAAASAAATPTAEVSDKPEQTVADVADPALHEEIAARAATPPQEFDGAEADETVVSAVEASGAEAPPASDADVSVATTAYESHPSTPAAAITYKQPIATHVLIAALAAALGYLVGVASPHPDAQSANETAPPSAITLADNSQNRRIIALATDSQERVPPEATLVGTAESTVVDAAASKGDSTVEPTETRVAANAGERSANTKPVEVPDPQLVAAEAARAAVEAAVNRLKEQQEWEARRALIAEQMRLQDEWTQRSQLLQRVARYVKHDEWALRAIGAIVLSASDDCLALVEMEPALRDENTMVRAIALRTLATLDPDKVRAAVDAPVIVEAVIDNLETPELTRHCQSILTALAGSPILGSDMAKEWWNDEQDRLVGTKRPYSLAQFTKKEIARYYEEEGIRPGRTGVVGHFGGGDDDGMPAELLRMREHGLDLAICLDVTSSMTNVLGLAVEEVERISKILSGIIGNCRIGLVCYRDEVTATLALTTSWKRFEQALAKQRAHGGGDYPEAVGKALATALLRKMGWRVNATKSLIIVGDAPPRDMELCTRMARKAKSLGIPVHAIYPKQPVGEIQWIVNETGGQSTQLMHQHLLTSILTLIFGKQLESHVGQFLTAYLDVVPDFERNEQSPGKRGIVDRSMDSLVAGRPGK